MAKEDSEKRLIDGVLLFDGAWGVWQYIAPGKAQEEGRRQVETPHRDPVGSQSHPVKEDHKLEANGISAAGDRADRAPEKSSLGVSARAA